MPMAILLLSQVPCVLCQVGPVVSGSLTVVSEDVDTCPVGVCQHIVHFGVGRGPAVEASAEADHGVDLEPNQDP